MIENGLSNKMDFQDYKRLTPDEREYFLFDTLCRVDMRTAAMDTKYASKWVETAARMAAGLTFVGIVGALLSKVGIVVHGTGQ